ncbi:Hpt domain-containing protein [Piscinibacter sp. HJYY11]|uniref:hybrid sensor histidine kinase/response regulator n=1 Tax=Piscinibacter sp. HJYY11 TaxID=2801333 RepID=UPI001F023224|nr:Hpt domain-containing protein [Piscinibacter sp. HJYY11]
MSETMSEMSDDLSALAWVHEELRRSLDNAHKALRRFVKESESMSGSDVDAVDPAVLRTARQQIHQGVGALELVGLPSVAVVLRASEAAVQRFVAKPEKITEADVDAIELASFALLDYLQRMLSGKPVSSLALFPRYQAVQALAGAERVHPADLWNHDWRWLDLGKDSSVTPRALDQQAHDDFEKQLLPLLRGNNPKAASALSDLCAGLGLGASSLPAATQWKLAAAFFESQAAGLLKPDVYSKRVASRLLAQLRAFERGGADVSERLAQDMLFFCAQSASPGDGRKAPRLAAARQAYGLAQHVPADYEINRLGRFDPAVIAQARKRVSSAKDAWSGVAGGEMHRLGGLSEQFSLVGDSLKRLYPNGEMLADELQNAIAQTQQSGAAPQPPLAMEVATSVLYLEASLEDGDFDDPDEGKRVARLAQRIASVRAGHTPDPLEAWMEELYRRVSDRQTMGSVVQELRASLSEAEKHIDQFFRNPADRPALAPVPQLLSSMRGVLSVLGMDQAAHAVLRMRDDVDGLLATEVDPQQVVQSGTFDRLASNLGALGFLIDMLSVQPQVAKSLFVYDAQAGTLSPLMGRSAAARQATNLVVPAAPAPVEPRLIEQAQSLAFAAVSDRVPLDEVARDLDHLSQEAKAADQPELLATVEEAKEAIEHASSPEEVAAVREELSDKLADFVHTASGPIPLDEAPVVVAKAPPPPPLSPAPTSMATDLGDDPEMREIFLEEAREVIDTAKTALGALAHSPANIEQLTTVRRAFHTLKGSSRMVGLKEFGEAGWACEQVYNSWLADQKAADPSLLGFTTSTLDYFAEWVEAISRQNPAGFTSAPVKAAADALGRGEPIPAIAASPANDLQMVSLSFPVDLPSEKDLELKAAAAPAPAAPVAAPALPEVSFDLDLGSFDDPKPHAAPVAATPAPGIELRSLELPDSFDEQTVIEPRPAAEPLPAADSVELIELELDDKLFASDAPEVIEPAPAVAPEVSLPEVTVPEVSLPEVTVPVVAEQAEAAPEAPAQADDDQVKVVGDLRISIPLFNIYLNEADELSRRLTTEVAEWAMELHRPVGEVPIALAHSLAGNSATVGFADLSHLARLVEHALMRSQAIGSGTPEEARLFVDASEEVRRLLHQFAAGFLKPVAPELLQRLADHEISSARRLEAANAAEAAAPEVIEPVALVEEPVIAPEPVAAPPARVSRPAPLVEHADDALVAHVDSTFGGLDTNVGSLGQAEFKALAPLPVEDTARAAPVRADALDGEDDIDAVDAVDAELFPIFEEEAEELLPQLDGKLREWARRPTDNGPAAACMRTLHTLKGGARLAGAMRLGEMAHRLETAIEHLLAQSTVTTADVDALHARSDALSAVFEALRSRDAQAYAEAEDSLHATFSDEPVAPPPVVPLVQPVVAPVLPSLAVIETPPLAEPLGVSEPEVAPEQPVSAPRVAPAGEAAAAPSRDIDWSRFTGNVEADPAAKATGDRGVAASNAAVRVRGPLLERLVNQAGEVSITRSRIESEVGNMRNSLGDLTDNLERLRLQLRDIEFQAETQMISRQEAAKAAHEAFDPLESDRFTRFQELTRMMAESVNDVATVQRTLTRTLETTEDELASQARLTRDLQDDLLRTRMVEFESSSDRLYRVVRQAAKETGKQVRLDIVGGSIEIDRGVLDRMTPAFEHLLRNCVTHGIESPDARAGAGKDATGNIVVALHQEGNEVAVEFRDDGAGLNLARIRDKGLAMGLLNANEEHSAGDLANLIFTPGFSTAETVTELAGRGVGMDVVRSEVNAMGGRIETATAAGQGTSFKLVLPLTTAVTQVVMVRSGSTVVALPATLIEIVRRASAKELEDAYAQGTYTLGERSLLFFWFGSLLQESAVSQEPVGRTRPVVVVRSAQQRIALHVDEVLGTQEVVVKNLGPQLSRLPGLAGMTLLASGAVALIYNPVALATLFGESARAATVAALRSPNQPVAPTVEEQAVQAAPLVLVVDDSLTVRRVTQRLLVREGYRVTLAKDGIEALECLADELPQVVLSDIEMPRMDGFDLVRNIRGDTRLRALPVIMITSRIAQKHRDYAAELGVDHYLGKPYSEEDLLALIGRYTAMPTPV